MGQGIRTLQRWELIGLPVHRPRGVSRSAVVAFPEELDAWSHAAPIIHSDEIAHLKAEIELLKAEVKSLKRQLDRAISARSDK